MLLMDYPLRARYRAGFDKQVLLTPGKPAKLAGPLTEAVQLGDVATRCPGVNLEWDAAALRIPNHPAADKLLTQQYRKDWNIAAVS